MNTCWRGDWSPKKQAITEGGCRKKLENIADFFVLLKSHIVCKGTSAVTVVSGVASVFRPDGGEERRTAVTFSHKYDSSLHKTCQMQSTEHESTELVTMAVKLWMFPAIKKRGGENELNALFRLTYKFCGIHKSVIKHLKQTLEKGEHICVRLCEWKLHQSIFLSHVPTYLLYMQLLKFGSPACNRFAWWEKTSTVLICVMNEKTPTW